MAINYLTGFELDAPGQNYLNSGWSATTAATYGGVHNASLLTSLATDHVDSHQPTVGYGGGGRCLYINPDDPLHWSHLKTADNLLDNDGSGSSGLSEYILSFSYKPMAAHQTGGNRILMCGWDKGYANERLFEFTQDGVGSGSKFGVVARLQTGETGGSPTFTTQTSATQCFTHSPATWAFVQILVKQHDTAGKFKLIVNNVVQIDYSGPLNAFVGSPAGKTENVAFEQEGTAAKYDHFVVYNSTSDETEARYEKHIQGLMPSSNDNMGGFARGGTSVGATASGAWTDINGGSNNPEDFISGKFVTSSVGVTPATDQMSVNMQDRSIVHGSWAPTHIPSVAVVQVINGTESANRALNRISGSPAGFTDGTIRHPVNRSGTSHIIGENWNTNPQTSTGWTGTDLDALRIGFKKD